MRTGQDFSSGQGLAPKGRFEKDCGALHTYSQALSREDSYRLPRKHSDDVGSIILTILQMRKLRHKGVDRIDWKW